MSLRNDCIDAVQAELERFGLKGVVGERGKHLEVRWCYQSGQQRFVIVPRTPSDWRSSLNARSDARRLLKEDGATPPLTTVVSFQRAMSLPKAEDTGAVRLEKLEKDFLGILDWVGELDAKMNGIDAKLTEILARMAHAKVVVSFDLSQEATVEAAVEKPVVERKFEPKPKPERKSRDRKGEILRALSAGSWMHVGEIARIAAIPYKNAHAAVHYLKITGLIESGARGYYRLVPKAQAAEG